MSIPTPFNPLGTLGGKIVPWVQPIMLSNDEVDTTRPFSPDNLLHLDQSSTFAAGKYFAWWVFSASSSQAGWAPRPAKEDPDNWLEMRFDKPTRITEVSVLNRRGAEESSNVGTLHLLADTGGGNFVEIAQGEYPATTAGLLWEFTVPQGKQGFYLRYRIHHGQALGGWISRGLELTADYKS